MKKSKTVQARNEHTSKSVASLSGRMQNKLKGADGDETINFYHVGKQQYFHLGTVDEVQSVLGSALSQAKDKKVLQVSLSKAELKLRRITAILNWNSQK